jgi:TfoX/Sxy family transcriptional regulator of competence genes
VQIPKPTDADKERFKSLVPDDARVEVKPMFGNLGAFVNGNMFMGLFGADVGVKLDDGDRSQPSDSGGGPFGPVERPMGGYITLPAATTSAEANRWVARSLEYVGALPPKKSKPAKKR